MSSPPHGPGPSGREPTSDTPAPPGPPRPVDADVTGRIVPGESVPGAPSGEVEPQPGHGGVTVADAEHNPSLNKLSATLRKGAAISAVMLGLTQVLSLTQAIVTARLLSPVEIGVFTLGTMFSNYLVTLAGGGMKAALIQRGSDVEDAANTAFWASVVTGFLMSTIALLSAPLLGMFFDDQMVGLVAAVTCGTLLIHALLNVPDALMQRRFNFKRKLIVDPITSGTFTVVSIVAVVMGYGVWGLVTALYASQIATLIAVWGLGRWRPGKGRFRYRIWREMASFSFPLIVQGIAANFRDSAQPAIVGRFLDVATAGQYRYGRRIGILPGQAIIQVASYVLFPAFARIADDATRFHRGFLRALRLLWTVTLPMGVLLAAIGTPAIIVLLGPEWAPAGLFVAAMAGFGPGTAMSAVGVESIKGAGRSKLIHWVTGTSIVVGIGGLIALLPLGLLGVGLAASLEGLVAGTLTLLLARPLVGVAWSELGRVMTPPLIGAAIAGAATAALEHLVLQSATRSIPLGLFFLLVDILVFAGLYLIVMSVLAPATVRELVDLFTKLRNRRSGGGGGDGGDSARPSDGPDDPDGADGSVGGRGRRGEDDLLDAPTIWFRIEPETQRLMPPQAFRPVPPPRRAPRPQHTPPPEVSPPTTRIPVVDTPRPTVDAPTRALGVTPPAERAPESNGTNGTNGHANGRTNGHTPDARDSHGQPSNGSDAPGAPSDPPRTRRRMVSMTEQPTDRRRR